MGLVAASARSGLLCDAVRVPQSNCSRGNFRTVGNGGVIGKALHAGFTTVLYSLNFRARTPASKQANLTTSGSLAAPIGGGFGLWHDG